MDKSGIGGLNAQEHEYFAHSLDVFDQPKTESKLLDGKDVFYNPISTITDDGPYEFLINRDLECHFYLPRTRLHGAFKIVKADGNDISDQDDVSIANLMCHNLFKQVELYVNGTQVVDLSSPTYPWKAFLETYLSYSSNVKNTSLQSSLFHDDEAHPWPPKFKKADGSDLQERNKLIEKSKQCFFVTPIHIDFFNSERMLPPLIDLKLRFTRANQNFGIISPDNAMYKIKLVDLKLEMRKVLADIETRKQFEVQLMRNPAIFPYPMSKIRMHTLSRGITSQNLQNIVSGRLPRTIIIGLLHTESYSGSTKFNPFYFHHFDLNYLCLRINGQNYPSQPFKPNWDTGNFMREYRHTIDSCGIAHDNISNGLTPKLFANSKTIYCFDLSPDVCNGEHLHINR